MIRAFSIIVPVLNKETEIIPTLDSIAASIDYFYEHYPADAPPVEAEVLVVNEGSRDRTAERVTQFIQDKPAFKLIHHTRSLGAGTARNTGAKLSNGDILLFCDGDDLFFKEHVYLCVQALNHAPQTAGEKASFQLLTREQTYTIELPNYKAGVVKTGVYTQDPLHPYWKVAVENTLPQNLAIRRECHDFLEGFPEAPIYKQIGCEDVAYAQWISTFFKVFKINIDTVEYIRYPGNNFDRQLKKFQTPPDQYHEDMPLETRQQHGIRQKLEQEKKEYLLAKFWRMDKPPEFLAVVNWQQLAAQSLAQQQYEEAIRLYEQGLEVEPQARDSVRNALAAAYNNYGSILRKQGNLATALDLFRRAIAVRPDLPPADLAKLHFNVAMVLRDQQEFPAALAILEQALQIEPNFPEALAEQPMLRYRTHIQNRGYAFSPYALSAALPRLEVPLKPYAGLADLRVLDVGSGEGCSTCWLLDHVVTHPSARLTCVDRFAEATHPMAGPASGSIEQRFDQNLQQTGATERVRKVVGDPVVVLRSLLPDSFHLVYINRTATTSDLLEQLVLTWSLVKVGGFLAIAYDPALPVGPEDATPKGVLDLVSATFRTKIRVIDRGEPMLWEKIAP